MCVVFIVCMYFCKEVKFIVVLNICVVFVYGLEEMIILIVCVEFIVNMSFKGISVSCYLIGNIVVDELDCFMVVCSVGIENVWWCCFVVDWEIEVIKVRCENNNLSWVFL